MRLRLPIADPCDEDWSAMGEGERRRLCGRCGQQVHFLSRMREAEALALLADHRRSGEPICVRYYAEPGGRLVFAPEPPTAPRWLALCLGVMALTACIDSELELVDDRHCLVEAPFGELEAADPPPEPLWAEPPAKLEIPDAPTIAEPPPKPKPVRRAKPKPKPKLELELYQGGVGLLD